MRTIYDTSFFVWTRHGKKTPHVIVKKLSRLDISKQLLLFAQGPLSLIFYASTLFHNDGVTISESGWTISLWRPHPALGQ